MEFIAPSQPPRHLAPIHQLARSGAAEANFAALRGVSGFVTTVVLGKIVDLPPSY
jgi:hypothetical protein